MIDPRERLVLLTVGEAIRLNDAAHALMSDGEPERVVAAPGPSDMDITEMRLWTNVVRSGHGAVDTWSLRCVTPFYTVYTTGDPVSFTETNLRECQSGVGLSTWARRWIRLLKGELGKHGRRFTKQERRAAWRQKMRAHKRSGGSHD